jgi:hypothetical protein
VTNGIGNPDWQRRYVTSAVPLFTGSFADDAAHASGINDSNGYQYLQVSTNDAGASTFKFVQIIWWQDAAGTLEMGFTDWTIPPNTFEVIKVPVVTRYYMVQITPVGGASGTNTSVVIYGTNADQENLLTQNTATPLLFAQPAVAANGTFTQQMSGIFGGKVGLCMSHNTNNTWAGTIDYYDWNSQSWLTYWRIFGGSIGQSFNGDVYLPYAPIRVNLQNLDAAAHGMTCSLVAP